jgi:hypothetical protein
VGSDSDRKVKRVPRGVPGTGNGVHSTQVDECHCGACSTGFRTSTNKKIGRKAETQEVVKKVKK